MSSLFTQYLSHPSKRFLPVQQSFENEEFFSSLGEEFEEPLLSESVENYSQPLENDLNLNLNFDSSKYKDGEFDFPKYLYDEDEDDKYLSENGFSQPIQKISKISLEKKYVDAVPVSEYLETLNDEDILAFQDLFEPNEDEKKSQPTEGPNLLYYDESNSNIENHEENNQSKKNIINGIDYDLIKAQPLDFIPIYPQNQNLPNQNLLNGMYVQPVQYFTQEPRRQLQIQPESEEPQKHNFGDVEEVSKSPQKDKRKSRKGRKLKKKRVHRKPVPEVINPSRVWVASFNDRTFARSKVSISSRSRLVDRTNLVAEKLYSSIRYQFFIEIKGNFDEYDDFDFLLGKIKLFESKLDKCIPGGLEGEIECALGKKENFINGKLRAKFQQSLSSHTTNQQYYYVMEFYVPTKLDSPVFIVKSPVFKIFSRKPNLKKKRKKKKKKKKGEVNEEEEEEESKVIEKGNFTCGNKRKRKGVENEDKRAKKRRKLIQDSNYSNEKIINDDEHEQTVLEQFQIKFDELLEFQKGLKDTEKDQCQHLLLDWLLKVIPNEEEEEGKKKRKK